MANEWNYQETQEFTYYIPSTWPSTPEYRIIHDIKITNIDLKTGKCNIEYYLRDHDCDNSGGDNIERDNFTITEFNLDKYNYRFSIVGVDIDSNTLNNKNDLPIKIRGEKRFDYPGRPSALPTPIRIERQLKWSPPNIELKINNSKKTYSNGWVKVNGQLRQIDKIWTKINGELKEV